MPWAGTEAAKSEPRALSTVTVKDMLPTKPGNDFYPRVGTDAPKPPVGHGVKRARPAPDGLLLPLPSIQHRLLYGGDALVRLRTYRALRASGTEEEAEAQGRAGGSRQRGEVSASTPGSPHQQAPGPSAAGC